MGNYFTTTEFQIEEIINQIESSDKFIDYQEKFEQLVPSRDVYVDDNDHELIIEVIQENSYSIHQYEYNWLDTNITDKLYTKLDKLYNIYIEQIPEQPNQESLKVFLQESVKFDRLNWEEWLDNHFHPISVGFKKLSSIKMTKPFNIGSGIIGYPPSFIWYFMLKEAITNDYLIQEGKVTSDGMILVTVDQVDGRWWYTGITAECWKHVNNIYMRQYC